jgi:dihydrolipoamide dehydrogenase
MYDIGIIGGGPAGYIAAEKAGKHKLSVVLFESKTLGGVCLNEGCIPTKTLLFSAKLLDYAQNAEKYGIKNSNAKPDFGKMMERKVKVVKKLLAAVELRMKNQKVNVIRSKAEILGNNKGIITIRSGNELYECRHLIICTGSETIIPPIKGLNDSPYLTSREMLNINSIPDSLVIIGGGIIGLEFANIFNSLGSKVSVIEMTDEILPGMDRDISQILRKEFSGRGIDFHLNARVTEVKKEIIILKKGEQELEFKADKILVSTGRKPVISGFGIENLGVELINGHIKIDEHCRTNIPNVYAAGDVTGYSMLAHTASREGEVAVSHILGNPERMRYHAIPGVVYTNPEIAVVGMTENEALAKGMEIEVHKLPMTYSGRFLAENDSFQGMCKIIAGKKYNEILGVHIIGNPASELIFGASIAIEAQLTVSELKEIIFPHPTVSEIMKEVIGLF